MIVNRYNSWNFCDNGTRDNFELDEHPIKENTREKNG